MTRIGKPAVLLATALLLLVATGCWDRKEIEERTSVVAIALDKHPAGIRVSVQVPIPVKIIGGASGGGGGGQTGVQNVHTFSTSARNITEALMRIQNASNQRLFLGSARLLIISENVAKAGLRDDLDALRRHPEIRRNIWLLVVPGEAHRLLEISPNLEQIPADYLINIVRSGTEEERIPNITLGQFLINLSNTSRQPVANVLEARRATAQWKGVALFRNDRLVGHFSPGETWVFMQLTQATHGGTITCSCPAGDSGSFTFTPRKADLKRRARMENSALSLHLEVTLDGVVNEKNCRMPLDTPEHLRAYEQQVERELERTARSIIRYAQQRKTDVFDLGFYLRAMHPNIWKIQQKHWDEKGFPAAHVTVRYHVHITQRGFEVK
ncbi:MAG TPA: Ger(x)C family spore germination protein [Calditerricola sp.]